MRGNKVFSGMSTRRVLCIVAMGVVIFAGLCVALYFGGRTLERGAEEPKGDLTQRFEQPPAVVYNGVSYTPRTNLTSILVMGVDRSETTHASGFRNGGQADFLLLLVIDHEEKRIRQLQIDRDTMTEITVLGVLGNEGGTRTAQICLSHGFGDGGKQSSGYTLRAVENLLGGVDIGLYVALDMNAIGVLNDALGGVTVTIEDDFSAVDPAMTPGATLTLTGEQAEQFVRFRMTVGDGTNASRMRRQRAYLSSAGATLKQRLEKDPNYIGLLFDSLEEIMVTNVRRGRMINEANLAYLYDILPVDILQGEYRQGKDEFMEFYADQQALAAWVMDAYFQQQQ